MCAMPMLVAPKCIIRKVSFLRFPCRVPHHLCLCLGCMNTHMHTRAHAHTHTHTHTHTLVHSGGPTLARGHTGLNAHAPAGSNLSASLAHVRAQAQAVDTAQQGPAVRSGLGTISSTAASGSLAAWVGGGGGVGGESVSASMSDVEEQEQEQESQVSTGGEGRGAEGGGNVYVGNVGDI